MSEQSELMSADTAVGKMHSKASRFLVPTETITIPQPDKRYLEDLSGGTTFRPGEPIAIKEFFQTTYSHGREQKISLGELPVYADFFWKTPDSSSPSDIHYAIIGKPDQIELPEGQKSLKIWPYRPSDGEYLDEYGWPYSSDVAIDKKPNGSVAVIPQTRADDKFEGIIPVQSHDDNLADRFPEAIHFKTKVHRGSYSLRDQEAYVKKLEQQIKRTWVKLADGLGIPVALFPASVAEFWAPSTITEQDGATIGRKIKNSLYRRIIPPPLRRNGSGVATPTGLQIKLNEQGEAVEQTVGHELMHVFLMSQKINYTFGYGNFVHEGIASAAELPLKGMPPLQEADTTFQEFEEEIRGAIDSKINSVLFDSESIHYQVPNAILHLYLLKERGGLENFKKFFHSPLQLVTFKQLTDTYQTVYGESLFDLLTKAKAWYEDVQQRDISMGQELEASTEASNRWLAQRVEAFHVSHAHYAIPLGLATTSVHNALQGDYATAAVQAGLALAIRKNYE